MYMFVKRCPFLIFFTGKLSPSFHYFVGHVLFSKIFSAYVQPAFRRICKRSMSLKFCNSSSNECISKCRECLSERKLRLPAFQQEADNNASIYVFIIIHSNALW